MTVVICVVCLVYVERLMETANVPLVSQNWRPILLCGLLLASKVWQDLRLVTNVFVVCIVRFVRQLPVLRDTHNAPVTHPLVGSSWNSEFSQIYPQFTLQAINKLEVTYCKEIKWNLYISSSAYAKYYFALRSLTEKSDFRR